MLIKLLVSMVYCDVTCGYVTGDAVRMSEDDDQSIA